MRAYFAPILLAIFFLGIGLVLGVSRLMYLNGILAEPFFGQLYPHHGEIMVFGFLGTLIITERYIGTLPLNPNRYLVLMPFLVSIGVLIKLIGWVSEAGALNFVGAAFFAAGVLLYICNLVFLSRFGTDSTPYKFMGLGALLLLASSIITLGRSPVSNLGLSFLMLGFPVLTILGERIELAKFTVADIGERGRRALSFAVLSSLLLVAYVFVPVGLILTGSFLFYLPIVWTLYKGEMAGKAKKKRLMVYIRTHLRVAYLWLFLGLGLLVLHSLFPRYSPALFDASTHSIAAGFIFTMILAHAPVIGPAILGRKLVEEHLSLAPLTLLTVANTLRVGGYILKFMGVDLSMVIGLSGVVFLVALLSFAATMVRAVK